jgi:hypothetical protein
MRNIHRQLNGAIRYIPDERNVEEDKLLEEHLIAVSIVMMMFL